jgi:hypothetical protein
MKMNLDKTTLGDISELASLKEEMEESDRDEEPGKERAGKERAGK